VAEWQTQET